MRKIILPALALLLCQTLAVPAPALSQDAPAAAQPEATKQPAKSKTSKQAKKQSAENAPNSSTTPTADDDSAVTKPSNREMNELDKFLGAPVTPSASSSSSTASDNSTPSSSSDTQTVPSASDMQTPPSTSTSDTSSDNSAAPAPTEGPREVADDDDKQMPDNRIKAGELNNDAITAMNSKQFEKAITLLSQAIRIDPTYEQGKSNLRVAYFNYGVALYNAGKYTEALPWIQKAVALSKQLHREDPEMQSLLNDCQQAVKETHH